MFDNQSDHLQTPRLTMKNSVVRIFLQFLAAKYGMCTIPE